MLLNRKSSIAQIFKGTGFLPWLNFKGKVYCAAVILLIGLIVQGFLILLIYQVNKEQQQKYSISYERATDEFASLAGIAPALLGRCQAALAKGAVVETADIRESVMLRQAHLKRFMGNDIHLKAVIRDYRLLANRLKLWNNTGLSISQYIEIKKLYARYSISLSRLGNYIQLRKNSSLSLFQQWKFIVMTVLILIMTLSLSGLLLISAFRSIVIPAKLMTEIFNRAEKKVFGLELPITSGEGLGKAALLLNDSLSSWNSKFKESKDSVCLFDNLCKELVTGIRQTELYAIQLQEVAETLTENFINQEALIAHSHQQLLVLEGNIEELHNIPSYLMAIHDDLNKQLLGVRSQTGDILTRTFQYQDELTEIADLAENLAAASEKVGSVITILNEVADRTELLAFNTAIQAARAGEKGLGFGVVAKEIAKLADHSKKASLLLTGLLAKIKLKNTYILKLIADNNGSMMRKPVNKEVTDICSTILDNAQNSFTYIEQFAKVMETIFKKSDELSNQAGLIAQLTAQENTEKIDFKLDMLEYQLNVNEANRVVDKVSNVSGELRTMAEVACGEGEL